MTDDHGGTSDGSSIDDVRRIREQFSRESGGDIRRHVAQTQAAFDKIRDQLKLRTVETPKAASTLKQ